MTPEESPPGKRSATKLHKLSGSRPTVGVCMRWVFSASALFTILALGLIIVILLKESTGFFRQYHESLQTYRVSGMEFTQLLKSRHHQYIEIAHELTAIRSDWIIRMRARGLSDQEIESALNEPAINALFKGYIRELDSLREHLDERIRMAIEYRRQLEEKNLHSPNPGRPGFRAITGRHNEYRRVLLDLDQSTRALFENASDFAFNQSALNRRLVAAREANERLHRSLEKHMEELAQWDVHQPVAKSAALVSFLTGQKWVTASDQQNWFGLLPLLSGSLMVSSIALLIAAPLGIGSAIYINQIAKPGEAAFIKPFIEFISAMPTVVLGFFGVIIFGEFVREFSRIEALQWLPFFPIQERLNAFTAGSLLGFMAIPTIFTLTVEALNSTPRETKEASYAVGATRLQTTWRTIIPSALPGIVAAVMFGFGRVIGETMVVLLCAGNRVKIPEFEGTLQVFFEPVHTMTGMIAQEMGEVVYGSLHYHALFMIGVVLFIASLVVNYSARTLSQRSGGVSY